MPWLQVILDTIAQEVELTSEILENMGALSITLQDAEDQPVYEPAVNTTPLWSQTRVVALFSQEVDQETLDSRLSLYFPQNLYRIEHLADQEWTRTWMDSFKPTRFGKRLWICPSWSPIPEPESPTVLLDPGLAFGTGTHPTTALCLEWLERESLEGQTLIDYGCGSGILAIAAVKLGARRVWAIDNDPQALLATLDNAIKNKVSPAIYPRLPSALPDVQADGLLANIVVLPLVSLVTTFAAHVKTNAPVVLSGILKEQVPFIQKEYSPYFTITEVTEREGWMRIVAKKL